MGGIDEEHPVYGPFFGVMGAASAIIFSGKLPSSAARLAATDIDLSYDLVVYCMFDCKTFIYVNVRDLDAT